MDLVIKLQLFPGAWFRSGFGPISPLPPDALSSDFHEDVLCFSSRKLEVDAVKVEPA